MHRVMDRKNLMVLGTNESLLQRACELGYIVHAYGLTPPNKVSYAGKEVFFHEQNILDYDSLWKICQELNPVGVVSVCSELAMHPMHFLLRKMGIPCNSLETEQITTNKFRMRQVMLEAEIDSPKFMLVTDKMPFEDIEKSISGFTFPLIIKPVDLSASRGVMKIETLAELRIAVDYSLNWSKKKECILEEFVDGPEYSGESIAYQGKYTLLAITEKETTGAPHFVEVAHRQPANLSPSVRQKVQKTLFEAFKALGVEYGAIHPEFRITKEGRILFMEVATRMGGDHIGTELTPLSSGYDFLGMVIDICCGKKPRILRSHTPRFAEIHYITSQRDLFEYEQIEKDSSVNLIYTSDFNGIPKELNKSSDRTGYYIFTKK